MTQVSFVSAPTTQKTQIHGSANHGMFNLSRVTTPLNTLVYNLKKSPKLLGIATAGTISTVGASYAALKYFQSSPPVNASNERSGIVISVVGTTISVIGLVALGVWKKTFAVQTPNRKKTNDSNKSELEGVKSRLGKPSIRDEINEKVKLAKTLINQSIDELDEKNLRESQAKIIGIMVSLISFNQFDKAKEIGRLCLENADTLMPCCEAFILYLASCSPLEIYSTIEPFEENFDLVTLAKKIVGQILDQKIKIILSVETELEIYDKTNDEIVDLLKSFIFDEGNITPSFYSEFLSKYPEAAWKYASELIDNGDRDKYSLRIVQEATSCLFLPEHNNNFAAHFAIKLIANDLGMGLGEKEYIFSDESLVGFYKVFCNQSFEAANGLSSIYNDVVDQTVGEMQKRALIAHKREEKSSIDVQEEDQSQLSLTNTTT